MAKVRQLEQDGLIQTDSTPEISMPRPPTPPPPGTFESRVTIERTDSLNTRLDLESAVEDEEENGNDL